VPVKEGWEGREEDEEDLSTYRMKLRIREGKRRHCNLKEKALVCTL
jgi:hypothetical protein